MNGREHRRPKGHIIVKPLLIRSSWLRLTKWEYWPPWLTYLPVVAYVATLAVKHRSATIFTAANPAILAGGFIGESKIDILRGLSGSHGVVARSEFISRRLSVEARIAAAWTFLEREQLSLPIVLKPNEGQRGSGVVVARTRETLIGCLARSTVDTILQEYVPGLEFGVFYYRHPMERRGHILSITEKQLPVVVGDGRRTLEQLILDGDRTRGMARFHLERMASDCTRFLHRESACRSVIVAAIAAAQRSLMPTRCSPPRLRMRSIGSRKRTKASISGDSMCASVSVDQFKKGAASKSSS